MASVSNWLFVRKKKLSTSHVKLLIFDVLFFFSVALLGPAKLKMSQFPVQRSSFHGLRVRFQLLQITLFLLSIFHLLFYSCLFLLN